MVVTSGCVWFMPTPIPSYCTPFFSNCKDIFLKIFYFFDDISRYCFEIVFQTEKKKPNFTK